ncbi:MULTISPECIES: epoxyqueuosine reductase QueH [Thermodesulfovibrio]|uniref:epoxyqueuosine reductase QueH n=1 Tax=Thermodesulfovibrio TaxID=28261 RepID=UPI00345A759E
MIWEKIYGLRNFLEEVFFQWERPKRCERCYYLRLERTVYLAKEMRAEAFSTTLLQHPFKYHELNKEIGKN